jgi:hypothetical protein
MVFTAGRFKHIAKLLLTGQIQAGVITLGIRYGRIRRGQPLLLPVDAGAHRTVANNNVIAPLQVTLSHPIERRTIIVTAIYAAVVVVFDLLIAGNQL